MQKLIRILSVSLLVFFFGTNNLSYAATIIPNESQVILSTDPIHPYIHSLFSDTPTYNVLLRDKNSNNITDKVKKDLQKVYENRDSEAISKYLIANNIEFASENPTRILLQSTKTVSFRHQESWFTKAYYRQSSVDYNVAYYVISSIDISGGKIINARPVTLNIVDQTHIGSPYNEVKSHTIINNGYTSCIKVSFGMRIWVFSDYYTTGIWSKTYYYHTIAQ